MISCGERGRWKITGNPYSRKRGGRTSRLGKGGTSKKKFDPKRDKAAENSVPISKRMERGMVAGRRRKERVCEKESYSPPKDSEKRGVFGRSIELFQTKKKYPLFAEKKKKDEGRVECRRLPVKEQQKKFPDQGYQRTSTRRLTSKARGRGKRRRDTVRGKKKAARSEKEVGSPRSGEGSH